MPSDLEIIAAVNDVARAYANAAIPQGEKMLPEGYRCDLARDGFTRRFWFRAAKEYLESTGQDVKTALARHEAWLRSPANAPELYVERR